MKEIEAFVNLLSEAACMHILWSECIDYLVLIALGSESLSAFIPQTDFVVFPGDALLFMSVCMYQIFSTNLLP